MRKKILIIMVNLVIVLCLIAGCNKKEVPAEESVEEVIKNDVTIQVMALESAYGSEGWAKVAQAFTEKTGIKVDLIVDKNIEEIIENAVKAGDCPDVIHLAAGREKGLTEQFIKENKLVDITDILGMRIRQ